MSKIREVKNAHNKTTYYSIVSIYDNYSAVEWIGKVLGNNCLCVDYIILKDLSNRSDEGNTNKQLSPKVSIEDINREIKQRETDIISVTGQFDGKPLVVGVDLREHIAFVTTRNSRPANITSIEQQLNLIYFQ